MSNQIENFKHLISFLNSKEIDYALLGRRGSLQEIVAGDIDLVISNKDFKNLSALVREFSIQHDLQMIQCFEHEITQFLLVFIYLVDQRGYPWEWRSA